MKIRSSKQLKESMSNLDRVVNFKDDSVEVHSDMDIVMTDAYDESIKNVAKVEEIQDELDKKAETIIPEDPEAPLNVKNDYTATLKLDESFDDFDLTEARKRVSARDENDSDKYLDYDMFEFVYELLAAGAKGITNIAPKTPIVYRKKVSYRKNRDGERVPAKAVWGDFPMQKFMPIGSEAAEYGGKNEGTGVPQISVDGNDIIIYSNDIDDLKQASEGLAFYHIKTAEPKYKLNDASHWDYSMKVFVPVYSDGEVMLMSDYLDEHGFELEDVFNEANAKTFRKKFAAADKESKDVEDKIRNNKIDRIYDNYVAKAFRDGSLDLEDVYAEMCSEFADEGLSCDSDLRSKFFAEFDDDEIIEEE